MVPEKTVIEKPSIVMDGEGGGGIRAPRPSPRIRHRHRHRHMISKNESQDYNLTNTIWRIVLGKKSTVVVG